MAKREPTEEQKYIIENTDCPMLVIAGPGTGKTFTLVKRIISIIKNKKACPDELLIITFTKKAAGEMFERIYATLSFFAENPDTPAKEKELAGRFKGEVDVEGFLKKQK